jgi:multidrug efflux pump subunit AcrB
MDSVIGLLGRFRRARSGLLALLAVLMVTGIVAGLELPAAILPEVTFPRISIIADSGEIPPDEMVRTVTRPLEEAVRRVPDLIEVRSTTSRGSTEIHLDCRWRASMPGVLQQVQAQVDAIRQQLPAGTSVEARLMSPVQFPVLGFALTSRTRSLAELRDLAIMQLQPELARLPGAADIVVQGGQRPEARVTLDPHALEARHLDAARVADVIRKATALRSVGLLSSNGKFYLGLADARPADLPALRALPVPVDSGPPVPLASLGTVTLSPAPEFTRYVAKHGDAVLVNILRKPTASTIRLSLAAHDWFAHHPQVVPKDVEVETFYDQADLVAAAVTSVRDSLLVGALMAIVVVFLFLRSLRLGLAGAIVLPGSIALTLAGLALTGHTLNLMTLGGIAAAMGLVLDDAIVVVEHLAHRLGGGATGDRVREAMAEIVPTLTGSSLCTLAIFIPFMALDGVTGAFFRVLSLAMALMLATSLLLCIVVLPWLGAVGALRPEGRGRLHRILDRAMAPALRWRWLAIALPVALILAIVPLRSSLGSGFLPEMDEGSLILDYVAPAGLSAAETDRMLRPIERELSQVPEIATWSRRTGDQLGFFITESNTGDYVLRLKAKRGRAADEIAAGLRERIAVIQPELDVEFGQLIEDVVGDLTTSPEPIEVRVLGEDRAVGQQRAAEIADLLGKVPGVVDVRSGVVMSGPNVVFAPGPGARRVGLDAVGLADAIAPYVEGLDAGQITRGARSWPVRVVLPPPPGGLGPLALAAAPVPVPQARWVPLGQLALVRVEPGETEIARDNQRTMTAATARLSGRDLGSAMQEIQRRIRSEIALGPGMTIRYGGLWAEQQSSFRGLALVLVGAVAAVMLVLLFSFHSWRRTGAVLLVSIASLLGVFVALHLGGATFNITSFVGAIMVVGIVAENAYFLVVAFQDALAAGSTPAEAAAAAAHRRLRPVLMTTAAGIAALAPLALGVGAGSALLRPLALAVIGGFMNSAPLLLVVLPALLLASVGGRNPGLERP